MKLQLILIAIRIWTFLFILSSAAVIFRGFVAHYLWACFVTPLWEVPAPSIACCLGLSALINSAIYLTSTNPLTEEMTMPEVFVVGLQYLKQYIISSLSLLITGWCANWFLTAGF